MSLPSPIYPVLERFVEEQPDDDDSLGRAPSPQQNSLISSFDVNSIAASSTPITENSLHQRKNRSSPNLNLNDVTYMAGNIKENEGVHKLDWAEDHSSTNTTSCTDYSASQCFSRMVEDFKTCSSGGGWLRFLWRHHLMILGILLVLVLFASILKDFCGAAKVRDTPNLKTTFKDEIRRLQTEFRISKTDRYTLDVLGQQWMEEKPGPVVLTIGGKKSAELAQKMLKIADKISSAATPSKLIGGNQEISRAELHELVLTDLKKGAMPAVGVSSIDRLDWDAPLVLHAFADSDSFLVENSLLILAVEDLPSGSAGCEERLLDHLTDRWIEAGGSMDNVTPILSRIMDFVICV